MKTKEEQRNATEDKADAAQPHEPGGDPACPFCTSALVLKKDELVQAEYECEQPACIVGYSRSIFKNADTMMGCETAYHPEKQALVQVVDFGGCCSVYTRRKDDEEGRSRIPFGRKLSLRNVFDDIEYWLAS